MGKWLQKWDVPSDSDRYKKYIVAIDDDGNYGCSCPAWKFRRIQCKHIRRIITQETYLGTKKMIDAKSKKTEADKRASVTMESIIAEVSIIPAERVSRKFNFDE